MEKQADDFLCTFCHEKFTTVIKILPCGDSVCGICYDDLKNGPETFDCKVCTEKHEMPRCGLPENKALLRLLEKESKKPSDRKERELQTLIEENQEELKMWDEVELITAHFDHLEQEVIDKVDSAIKHLKKIEKDLLKEIEEHRTQLLKEVSPGSSSDNEKENQLAKNIVKLKERITQLSNKMNSFSHEWTVYFNDKKAIKSDQEIESALASAKHCSEQIASLKNQIKIETNNLMVFNPNNVFAKIRNHIGELLIRYPTEKSNSVK